MSIASAYARGVPIPWPELCLDRRQKIVLAGLFVAYLAMVAATIL